MKQKKLTQKLVLNKETIMNLERSDMKEVLGGNPIPGRFGCGLSQRMTDCVRGFTEENNCNDTVLCR